MDKTHFHRIFPFNSQDFTRAQKSFEFSGFYNTWNSFLIKPINANDWKSRPFLVRPERKRRGQGGVMWTENHKRLDTNYITWIKLIRNNTTNCAKLGLVKVQESYTDTSTAQSTAPGLFGVFPFAVWNNWRGGIHGSIPQSRGKNTGRLIRYRNF